MRSHAKVLVAVASLFALLALAPIASAAPKTVIAEIGGDLSSGNNTAGGLFNEPRGIAVNQSGAGGVPKGTFYVLDKGNFRIQQFRPNGEFVRLWGAGVLSGTASTFEVCTIAADCRRGSASSIAGGVGSGGTGGAAPDLTVDQVTGTLYLSDPSNNRIDVYGANGGFRGAFGWAVKLNGEASALQFCTTASECKAGSSGANAGQFGIVIGGLAVAPAGLPNAGNLFVANGNGRRVDEFKPTVEGGAVVGMSFVRGFGWDVANTGDPGNTGTVQFEVCATACKAAGATGTQPGNFSTNGPTDVAVDSEGNVFAVDVNPAVAAHGNKRIQEFSPAPAPIEPAFGAAALAATFGSGTNDPWPQGIAVDPSTIPNHVLVSGSRNASGGAVAVLELDHSGATVAVHGSELTAPESLGLAVVPTALAGNVFLSTRQQGPGNTLNRVFVLGDQATPTIEGATGLTAESAVLHGQVVSNNAETTYRFERSSDNGKTWVKVPGSEVVVPPTAGNVAVEQAASGLTPNTAYLFRLVSTRPTGGFPFTSDAESFTTLTAPPSVPDVGAAQVSDTSARLVGQVNPNGIETTYVFEYGTDPSLGESTTVASAGSGSSLLTLSRVVAGLSPNTTYFFQLKATNSAGSTTSPQRSFTTRATPLPSPDDRRYEMVSPPEKNFGPADGAGGTHASSSWDGERVAFCTSAQFGDDPPMATRPCTDYVSRRTPEGWSTKGVFPDYCSRNPEEAVPVRGLAEATGFSPNLDFGTFKMPESPACAIPPLDPSAPLGQNLYRAAFDPDPTIYDLLAPNAIALPTLEKANAAYAAASDDFGHVAYASTAAQTEGATGTFGKVYEWDHGTLRLVSGVKPDGSAITTSSIVPDTGELGNSDGLNVVSADGSRIFFQNEATELLGCFSGACQLYMREGGTKTLWVSQQECTVACSDTAAADKFEWATPSGEKALFTTTAKLNDEDATTVGADLYLFTGGPDPASEKNLTLLSKDGEPADGANGSVLGMLGMADDGNTVYFVASGQLIAGQPTATGPKLYRWRWSGGSPTLDYLATLESSPPGAVNPDEQNWSAHEQASGEGSPAARLVTPDGAELLVQTRRPLDQATDHDADLDLYLWNEAAGWTCLSCQGLGADSHGDATFDGTRFRDGAVLKRESRESRIVMSDDGKRVFFTTSDPLGPGDTNDARDVYEWNDGTLSLISDGAGAGGTLLGASRSGRDVFFYTTDKLVGWDTDGFTDIYDARIGGGFPEPPVEVPPCEDDACQGAQAQAPGAGQPGTLAPGAGDFHEATKKPRCRRAKTHRKKAKAHGSSKRHHKKKARPCRRRSRS